MSAPFSRLQLAAALLEYDNDPDDPSAPYRSAHESAIFAHLRRNTARPQSSQRRSPDHLGVALPSETESVLDGGRKSRASTIGPLRNMFSAEDAFEEEHEHEHEEEQPEEEMDLDLTSWGLDAFMSKDKNFKGKGKAKSLPSTQPLAAAQFPKTNDVLGEVPRRPKNTRSMSVGNYDFLSPAEEMRRKSIGSPLDLSGLEVPVSFQRPVASSSTSQTPERYDDEPEQGIGSIPFPTASIRSPSPMLLDNDRQRRTLSTASLDSKMVMNAPHLRTLSTATMDPSLDNPFALQPPSRASRFDPKAAAHARTMSNASMGSRMLLENDGASVMTGRPGSVMTGRPPLEHRYSTTLELLRPKVLVMPSPLQSTNTPAPPPPQRKDGFLVTDAPPLPPGARASRRGSTYGAVPIASNSFTPNPRLNLSLSQLTFRNNLTVGGQRDVGYNDIDGDIPRAMEDGEQVQLSTTPTMEMEMALPVPMEDPSVPRRPAGKLYGKSLIDDLESRKTQMKGKQRVFKGDDRPSMMDRTPLKRASTLIDPATLQDRPGTQRVSSLEPPGSAGLARRNSGHAGPLLNFDNDDKVPRLAPGPKGAPNRSVFGVDTLWEREMVKLREIEAEEAFERERQQAIEETEAMKKGKKKKKGKKGREGATNEDQSRTPDLTPSLAPPSEVSLEAPAVSTGPPVLPTIPTIRGPPPVINDTDSEESDTGKPAKATANKTEGWYAESSDEEDNAGPRRTTGVGLRYPKQSPKLSLSNIQPAADDSEEEDLPLAATIGRAVQRTTARLAPESDSDEEKPLSALMSKASLPSINFDSLSPPTAAVDDDDDQPLGLRSSRVLPNANQDAEDDDRPLAFHPEQQRRTQYQMMAQHQMMMQAQMQNSMFFNPMASGYFPPPMAMPPMVPQAPIPIPSPPPQHDAAKYGRVNQWRHDVAIEGE